MQIGVNHARLHHALQVLTLDREDVAHLRQGHDDAALRRDRPAGLARARAPRDDRRLGLRGEPHHGLHLGRGAGNHDDIRHALRAQGPERCVEGIRIQAGRIVDDAIRRHRLAKTAHQRRGLAHALMVRWR
ncbi:MAG: hypothetical protein E6I87_08515 [Chloroflexi bacterium]|nr:MAG: hypothetical protein E6I87_08515 [Chloroflexota bacterium]